MRLEELRFPSGELELVATLGLPAGPCPHPALVLVPDGGDSQRTQPATRFLAEYLPRFGYACLVYDKPYEATSGKSWWVGWYRRVMDFDDRTELATLRLPTLWLYGSADTQSDVVANLATIAELARDGRPWSVHLFPEGDHGIMVSLFERGAPRTMAAGYFELLLAWLARNSG